VPVVDAFSSWVLRRWVCNRQARSASATAMPKVVQGGAGQQFRWKQGQQLAFYGALTQEYRGAGPVVVGEVMHALQNTQFFVQDKEWAVYPANLVRPFPRAPGVVPSTVVLGGFLARCSHRYTAARDSDAGARHARPQGNAR
jgi:hypothetical protein